MGRGSGTAQIIFKYLVRLTVLFMISLVAAYMTFSVLLLVLFGMHWFFLLSERFVIWWIIFSAVTSYGVSIWSWDYADDQRIIACKFGLDAKPWKWFSCPQKRRQR